MDDDPNLCRIDVTSVTLGVLVVTVEAPDELRDNPEARDLYFDGAAAGVTAMANELWPEVDR